jgi:integrase
MRTHARQRSNQLANQLANQSEYVFPHAKDHSRPITSINWHWRQIRAAAGLDDVRLHDLRHSFASHAVRDGVPLPVVARLLGHANVKMTLRYAHVGDDEVAEAAERVGAAMWKVMGGYFLFIMYPYGNLL